MCPCAYFFTVDPELYFLQKMAETIVPGGPQAWISSERNLSDTKIVLRLWSSNEEMVWRTLVRAWVDDPGWLQQSERNSVNGLSCDSLCHNIDCHMIIH